MPCHKKKREKDAHGGESINLHYKKDLQNKTEWHENHETC
jgi:hypothetical protein